MPGDGETRDAKHSGSVVIGTASVGQGIRNARMYSCTMHETQAAAVSFRFMAMHTVESALA